MDYRFHLVSNYVLSCCMTDPSAARGQAIIALSQTIENQALIVGYSDAFVALTVMLILVAGFILLTMTAPWRLGPPIAKRRPVHKAGTHWVWHLHGLLPAAQGHSDCRCN
jgi:hypothetical protein